MSTSLQEQLRRLAVPQTASLVDRKYKASILFDTTEAATKDRRTIYDLGISGLQELISLNNDFKQFELTLFDETTLNLERAVEQSSVNDIINRNIKKFLQHLSPYLLLRPSHLCIEWLLRRFEIHAYNRSELMALALPYHETNIFVRLVQCMNFKAPDTEWDWLRKLQKPGVPLPKSSLINRATTQSGFLSFVCRSTVEILREFGARAHLLQTQINFYTTVVIGTFENVRDFKEWHISNVLESLLYTLSAKVVDVAAAGYMVAAQIISRTQLKIKLCKALLDRAITVSFEELRPAAVMLLILIFDLQESAPSGFSEKALNIILGQKWLISVIAALTKQNIDVLPLCTPLLRDAVRAIESEHDDADTFKRLALQLLNDLQLPKTSACQLINCFLDCYIHKAAPEVPKLQDGDTIDLDSDTDEEETSSKNAFTAWYSDYLRRLEHKYPDAFDATIKEALSLRSSGNNNRRMALKIALGYRLKMSNDTATDIYESLYHYNASIRKLAMQTLIANISNYQTRFQNLEILKACLNDRLKDDSRLVIAELLKLPSKDFIEILGYDKFAAGLFNILEKIETNGEMWVRVTPLVVRHLTSTHLLKNYDANLILLELMPLLFPSSNCTSYNAAIEEITKSDLVKKFAFIKELRTLGNSDPSEARKQFLNVVANKKHEKSLPTPMQILESLQKLGGDYFRRSMQVSNLLILFTVTLRDKITAQQSMQLFEYVQSITRKFETKHMETLGKAQWEEVISLQLYTDFLMTLLRHTKFENLLLWSNFEEQKITEDLRCFLCLFELISKKTLNAQKPEEIKIWSSTLVQLFEITFTDVQQKLDFLVNFYMESSVNKISFCGPAERLTAFKVLNAILSNKKNQYDINLTHFLKISNALMSPFEQLRAVTVKTLSLINENCVNLDESLKYLLQSILENSYEISMDKEQYPLMLYIALKSPKKRADQVKANKISEEIFKLLNEPNDVNFVAQLLVACRYFNDEQICIALIPLAMRTLDSIVTETSGTPAMLPMPFNRILYAILKRFQSKTIEQVMLTSDDAWKLFERIFNLHYVFMTLDDCGELHSLPCVLLDTLDAECFENLTSKYRFDLIKLILYTEAVAQNDAISLSAHKLLKSCKIECKPLVKIIETMYADQNAPTKTPPKKIAKRSSGGNIPVQTSSLSWKQGIALLELLESKEKLKDAEQLIPSLFELLKYCLEVEEQSGVEYVKQLTLSTLFHCCLYAKDNNINLQKAFPKSTFRIDHIVQCVRATQNPQTHQNALTLLVHCAAHFPQQVLHNIVDIFTFMGTSVVRHDDAFSFHIIDNIIQSIIPILVQTEYSKHAQNSVVPVLKVFSDIMLDVPEHRRISLYTKLLSTLGVVDHFWRFLCIVFEAQLMDEEKQKKNQTSKSTTAEDKQSKRIEFILTLSNTFPPEVILETCTQLLGYLKNTLPLSKDMDDVEMSETTSKASNALSTKPKRKSGSFDTESILFNVHNYNNKQLRHYKYIIMQYLSAVSKSPEFLRKIAMLSDEAMAEMKSNFQNFIISILAYVPTVNTAIERFEEPMQTKFWKVILHHLYDVLDNAISLLSPDLFLLVIIGLMQHQLLSIRKKVIDLLISKLQQQNDLDNSFIALCNEKHFSELIKPLNDIILGILETQQQQTHVDVPPSSPSINSSNELIFLQQTALIAVKLLSKHFSLQYVAEFKSLLATLTKIVKSRVNISKIVLATVVLALIEIASNLKAHSLEQLPKFMPQIIDLLKHQAELVRQNPPDHVCIAIVTGTQKLFESLPRFLGPYIVDIITSLCMISTRVSNHQKSKDQRSVAVVTRISTIWSKISSEVYIRIVVPSCEKSYNNLMGEKCYEEIEDLMTLLRECIIRSTRDDLVPVQLELRDFFLNVLEFRYNMKDKDNLTQVRIKAIESKIIEAFAGYVLKLSESDFRPLYEKVYDWALKRVAVPETQLTFFTLNIRLGESLKSLFVIFAYKFLEDAAKLLDTCNTLRSSIASDDEHIHIELLTAILGSLHKVFLYANQKFITQARFEMLMPKVVDQLENRFVLESESLQKLLIDCISQLAVVVSSDVMWKQLNYQVLLKTRTNVPEVRILSFNCCVEIARRLSDEFTTLLPETVPFIAELFEDENSRVEKNTRRAVQELETILGESLQKYL